MNIMVSSFRLDLAQRNILFDVVLVPVHPEMPTDRKFFSFLRDVLEAKQAQVNVTENGLRAWKELLPVFVERCRTTWQHLSSCEYAKKGKAPISSASDNVYVTPIRSYGIGNFPAGYADSFNLKEARHVFKNMLLEQQFHLSFQIHRWRIVPWKNLHSNI